MRELPSLSHADIRLLVKWKETNGNNKESQHLRYAWEKIDWDKRDPTVCVSKLYLLSLALFTTESASITKEVKTLGLLLDTSWMLRPSHLDITVKFMSHECDWLAFLIIFNRNHSEIILVKLSTCLSSPPIGFPINNKTKPFSLKRRWQTIADELIP